VALALGSDRFTGRAAEDDRLHLFDIKNNSYLRLFAKGLR
jgi:hypothetical protein